MQKIVEPIQRVHWVVSLLTPFLFQQINGNLTRHFPEKNNSDDVNEFSM